MAQLVEHNLATGNRHESPTSAGKDSKALLL